MKLTKRFDKSCREWSKEPEFNKMFLMAQRNFLSSMLKARGHVFLNEVYDSIGFERIIIGQTIGWSSDKSDEIRMDITEYDNGEYIVVEVTFDTDGDILNCLNTD